MKVTDQQNKILKSGAGIKRIIACAGSGKTFTLIQNIANILKDDKCRPDEILAITFTRNAAENMRRKIKETAGKNIDYEAINIFTFNSFGNMIISENSLLMGYGKDYRLINISKSWQILYSIVKEAELKNLTIGRDISKFIEDMLHYIWSLKSNLVSARELLKYHKNSSQLLQAYNSRALLKEEVEIALMQEELAYIYENYEKIKNDNNFIDYHDHVFLPYRLLSENRTIARQYAARYRYIFIDEFQDTDVAQGYLISLIYSPEHNTLTVVGDDDQGIYSFRGACVENILNFDSWESFREHTVENFYLTINFRSGEEIVKTIGNIISGNESRFDKDLKPEYGGKYSDVFFGFSETHEQEAIKIAENIKVLLSSGLKPKDIAIISRRKRFSHLKEILDRNDLKYELLSNRGFFYESEILFIISWLMMIHDTGNELYLLNLLKSRKYKISDRDIFFLKNYDPDAGRFFGPHEADSNSLMDALLKYKKNSFLQSQAKKRIADFLEELDVYISKSVFLRLGELISFIYENSGLAVELRSGFAKILKLKIRNIETLIKISSDFESEQMDSDFEGFITYLKDVAKTDEEDPDTIELSNSNTIKIMSIHAAKGLEFDAVFMPMLWKNDYSGRSSSNRFKVPATLRKDHKVYRDKGSFTGKQKFDEEVRRLSLEEERRIFYVGCSRAKRFLFLSCSSFENERELKKNLQKPKEILPFLADILRSGNYKILDDHSFKYLKKYGYAKNADKSVDLRKYLQDLFGTESQIKPAKKNNGQKTNTSFDINDDRLIQKNAAEFIEKISFKELGIKDKKTFKAFKNKKTSGSFNTAGKHLYDNNKRNFSLSELLTYLDCPKCYMFRHIYNIPEKENKDITAGEKVHKFISVITSVKFRSIIENEYLAGIALPASDPAQDLGNTESSNNISGYIEVFKKSSFFDCRDLAKILLEQLFYWNLNGYVIGCKVDRLDFKKDKTLRIIDYKVSSIKDDHINPNYINQLKAYTAVTGEVFKTANDKISCALLFLKDGKMFESTFTEPEIKHLKEILFKAIKNINQRRFIIKNGKSCRRSCNYYDLCKSHGTYDNA